MKTNHSARINLRVPIPLKKYYNQIAKENNTTLSSVIIKLMQETKTQNEHDKIFLDDFKRKLHNNPILESNQEAIRNVLLTLTPREEKVIKMLFGFKCPQSSITEIAKYFTVAEERVNQITARAKKKLEHSTRIAYGVKFDFENLIIN